MVAANRIQLRVMGIYANQLSVDLKNKCFESDDSVGQFRGEVLLVRRAQERGVGIRSIEKRRRLCFPSCSFFKTFKSM